MKVEREQLQKAQSALAKAMATRFMFIVPKTVEEVTATRVDLAEKLDAGEIEPDVAVHIGTNLDRAFCLIAKLDEMGYALANERKKLEALEKTRLRLERSTAEMKGRLREVKVENVRLQTKIAELHRQAKTDALKIAASIDEADRFKELFTQAQDALQQTITTSKEDDHDKTREPEVYAD